MSWDSNALLVFLIASLMAIFFTAEYPFDRWVSFIGALIVTYLLGTNWHIKQKKEGS